MKKRGYLTFLIATSLTLSSCAPEKEAIETAASGATKTELESVEQDQLKKELSELINQKDAVEAANTQAAPVVSEVKAATEVKAVTKAKATNEVIKAKKSPIKKPIAKKPIAKENSAKDILTKSLATQLAANEMVQKTDAVTTTQAATNKNSSSSSTLTAQLDPSLASGGRTGLRGQISLDGYTDFKETSREDKVYYSQAVLNLFYDLEGGNNIGLFVPMQKDLYGEYEEKFFLDARLSYAQNAIVANDKFIFNMRYGVLYPTTENSKVRDEMLFGLELNPTLIFPMSNLADGLAFIYIPRFRKRFHRFETNRQGEYLVNDSLLNIFVVSYQATPKWDLSSTLLYVSSQRYDGARTDDSFLTAQEIGYRVSPEVRARMGIMTGGNIINKQFGENETVEVFDENATEFYTGFQYQF